MGSPEEDTLRSSDSAQSPSSASATTVNPNGFDEKDLVRSQQQQQLKQQRQHPLAAIPKRKPVAGAGGSGAPVVTSTAVAHDASLEEAGIAHAAATSKMTSRWSQWSSGGFNLGSRSGLGKYSRKIESKLPFAHDRRKRRFFLIGVGAGIVILIALIIGLAVGLIVGKKGTASNLPLPTNHGGPYTGDLTYYNPALGSCGITSTDSDNICAVSHLVFDVASRGSDPNQNPLCGMKLRLRRDGRSVDVTVVDRCVGCKATDIDVSPGVFAKLANIDQGRVLVQWAWLEDAPVAIPA
ncbi:hypothetical protein VTN00DRAFT_3180 [Thermoascus crustaceus]|uniref:uncharacterized protein n=1 Tax=Thermoascus crustaceus TaxID=5088 RepID=UPI0037436A12